MHFVAVVIAGEDNARVIAPPTEARHHPTRNLAVGHLPHRAGVQVHHVEFRASRVIRVVRDLIARPGRCDQRDARQADEFFQVQWHEAS